MTKRKITIDADLWLAATKYADQQIAVMRKYGAAPYLDHDAFAELVYQCARYPQQLRNLNKKYEKQALKKEKHK